MRGQLAPGLLHLADVGLELTFAPVLNAADVKDVERRELVRTGAGYLPPDFALQSLPELLGQHVVSSLVYLHQHIRAQEGIEDPADEVPVIWKSPDVAGVEEDAFDKRQQGYQGRDFLSFGLRQALHPTSGNGPSS